MRRVRKLLAGVLAVVLLAGSMPDLQGGVMASYDGASEPSAAELVPEGTGDGADAGENAGSDVLPEGAAAYQYVTFLDCGEDVFITVPEKSGITALETGEGTLYRIDVAESIWFEFTASVGFGLKLDIPGELADILAETRERELEEENWSYRFGVDVSALSTTEELPCAIALAVSADMVPVTVSGGGIVSGVDENGMAQLGSEVSIEVTEPGHTLDLLTKDENGFVIYTAMELDYDNRYTFRVTEGVEFIISDPETAHYSVLYADTRKAKLTGVAGVQLTNLASSAQGYNEIVLNFTAVKNGSDGTDSGKVYYEVKVAATPQEGETTPAGSATVPAYYYIPKVKDSNTQSRSIKVNAGKLSAPTACTYEFSVRMVIIPNTVSVPAQDKSTASPLKTELAGNTITKSFATKNLYYEDKLGFTKKSTKIFTGQEDVLAGSVKYSKNASYIHDLTAVAYDSRGVVCDGITCTFRNDNDELYVSASDYMTPGKYKVVIYAGIGEEVTADSPQGGTMYQSNTSFVLTVEPGINRINTDKITDRVVLSSKNVTFSAVPVGYCWYGTKAKSQKFTYEIKGARPDELGYGYTVTEPTENVKNNISISKSGKVTVKKEYIVGTANNYTDYIAIVITGADFEGNTTTATKIVAIKGNAQTPTRMYLADSDGRKLSGDKFAASTVNGARVIVEDQGGQDMTQYVTITPTDNAKGTAGIYVSQSSYSEKATLYVRTCGTVTIKATSRDGKKKTLSLKVEITKPTSNTLVYTSPSITCDGMAIATKDSTWDNGHIAYGTPFKGVVIQFSTGLRINGKDYLQQWYDWGYSVTGGKAKVSGNKWTVTPTAQKAELKVWLKANPKLIWTLRFTNSKWGEAYEAAPSFKLVEGKLYSNKYTNRDALEHYQYEYDDGYVEEWDDVPDQTVTYSYGYLSVRTIQYASITKGAPYMSVTHNRDKRTITLSMRPGNDVKAGSYKYKFAFYDEYGYLYCKPMTITVKVNKSQPVKIAASYTMNNSQKGENSVTLKCTPGEFLPDFDTQLMNANVGGKANDFNKYFELAYVTDAASGGKQAVIRFKSTVTAAEKAALKGKSLTGYVRYSYYYGYSAIENATSKVTIKIN